ncbi:MAG: DUF1924 domain-containing protein [Thiolinea sp.]
MPIKSLPIALLLSALLATPALHAETPQDILETFRQDAVAADSNFSAFSAERGQELFFNKHVNDWSCASCHTDNPADPGKHARTGKTIDALAPTANDKRFTRMKKVEKWFGRNCRDVLERECTALEKGDVLTYLLTVKP